MAIRKLPDLTPEQVVRLQDALLANANTLLTSALSLIDLNHVSLARSLAILGLEESGKAIAIHERRVMMGHIDEGETFRCDELDSLWASHEKKLETVHQFLTSEPYWFDTEPPDAKGNANHLGTIKSWARRHDRSKQRGFYVDLSKTGDVMAPPDVADEAALREIIERVHQIGWQIRLGEHIEGKRQDGQEKDRPAASADELDWLEAIEGNHTLTKDFLDDIKQSLREGYAGTPLPNAAYRFNPPEADRRPFRNFGKPGYEAETRELMRLASNPTVAASNPAECATKTQAKTSED